MVEDCRNKFPNGDMRLFGRKAKGKSKESYSPVDTMADDKELVKPRDQILSAVNGHRRGMLDQRMFLITAQSGLGKTTLLMGIAATMLHSATIAQKNVILASGSNFDAAKPLRLWRDIVLTMIEVARSMPKSESSQTPRDSTSHPASSLSQVAGKPVKPVNKLAGRKSMFETAKIGKSGASSKPEKPNKKSAGTLNSPNFDPRMWVRRVITTDVEFIPCLNEVFDWNFERSTTFCALD